ncbi:MAG: hypothetical protein LLG20_00435 [Acidobacteriales bacterium]|nr:hypothetical protein [Terriglobales bacterium]
MFEDAVKNLSRVGYTHDEAAFLCLAAIHSGYFVRRQFSDFLRQPRGGTAARFIEKLVANGHAQVVHFRLNRLIYHIRTLKVYARLDQADNRNRREKAPLTIKRKLLCLDFVLAHRAERFLRSEAEKVAYFTESRGIPIENLPVRRYEPRRFGEATLRYFVDKLPVYVSGDTAAPVVYFAYVDEGAESLGGFETFLNQYHSLFAGLGTFEVVYVATDSLWAQKAQRIFSRRYAGEAAVREDVDSEQARMLRFFEMRRKWDARDFAGFSTEKVIQYREEKQRFAGAEFDALYSRWVSGGESRECGEGHTAAAFRTFLLPHDYELFGSLRHAS